MSIRIFSTAPGGGSSRPDWQDVMGQGNTSNINGKIVDNTAQRKRIVEFGAAIDFVPGVTGSGVAATSPDAVFGVSGAGLLMARIFDSNSGLTALGLIAQNFIDGWQNINIISFEAVTDPAGRAQSYTDSNGQIQTSGYGLRLPIKLTSVDYTALRADYTIIGQAVTVADINIELPTNPSNEDQVFVIKNISAMGMGNIVITPTTGTIDGQPNFTMLTGFANGSVTVQLMGGNYYILGVF